MNLHDRVKRWKNLQAEVAEEWSQILVEFSKLLRSGGETVNSLSMKYCLEGKLIKRHLRARRLWYVTIQHKHWTAREVNELAKRRLNDGATFVTLGEEFNTTTESCRKAFNRWRDKQCLSS